MIDFLLMKKTCFLLMKLTNTNNFKPLSLGIYTFNDTFQNNSLKKTSAYKDCFIKIPTFPRETPNFKLVFKKLCYGVVRVLQCYKYTSQIIYVSFKTTLPGYDNVTMLVTTISSTKGLYRLNLPIKITPFHGTLSNLNFLHK